MEHPTFKEFSHSLDEVAKESKQPKMWLIDKWCFYFGLLFIKAFIIHTIRERQEEEEFKAKYRTVIKKNCLGLTSYEYHER